MNGKWVRSASNGAAVVFVHGVLSDGDTCWTNPNGTYWPALLCEETDLSGIGVYVFTYRSSVSAATYSVQDAVTFLKEQLRLDNLFACRTLIFVAHSMGGLVVRKLLVERAADFRDAEIDVGLFMVASPSMGSSYANKLSPFARLLGHRQADALRAGPSNNWLADLNREFKNLKEGRTLALYGKELVEDIFVALNPLIRRPVVTQLEGEVFFGEPLKIPGSDHFSIAKPASAEASQHRHLVSFIAERPQRASDTLDLEPELARQLRARLAACNEAGLPFRTFHKLLALFDLPGGFTTGCFEAAAPGTALRLHNWLRETVQDQASREAGLQSAAATLEHDSLLVAANKSAWVQRAKEIDERHLLLAILADTHSGTMEAIAHNLGEASVNRVRDTAMKVSPWKLRAKSRVASMP